MVVAQVVIFDSSYVLLCRNKRWQSLLYYYDGFLYDRLLNTIMECQAVNLTAHEATKRPMVLSAMSKAGFIMISQLKSMRFKSK